MKTEIKIGLVHYCVRQKYTTASVSHTVTMALSHRARFVETGVPTSVDFVQCEPTQLVVAYTSANAYVFDIEKSKPVIALDYKPSSGIINHSCLLYQCRSCSVVYGTGFCSCSCWLIDARTAVNVGVNCTC